MLLWLDKVMAEFECELTNITANETWYPSHKSYFVLALKITVGTTCILSILGASLIILTYLAFRDLRTTARKLLVNLSVADIVVAASHFVGLFTNYERFLYNGNSKSTDIGCSIQAAFTMYGSIASILWTIAVALYMFTVIVLRKPTTAKRTLPVYFLVCWGVPVVFTVSFGLKKYLGFEQSVDIGWCYVRHIPASSVNTTRGCDPDKSYDRVQSVLASLLGYDLWVYIAFIVLPVLYVTMHCYLRRKETKRQRNALIKADLKLIFVPLIFLLLRVWSFVIDIPAFYMSKEIWLHMRTTWTAAILSLLSGVGVSGQGLGNAILFCICTKQVRQKLLKALKSPCHHCCNSSSHRMHVSSTDEQYHEETTVFDNTDDRNSSVLEDLPYSGEWGMSEGEKLLRTGLSPNEMYGSN